MYAIEGCTADPTGAMGLAVCQVDAARGQVQLTAIAAGGVSGNLVLATVSFRIVDGAPKDIAPILTAPVLVDPAGRPIEVVIRYGIVD